jgi:hypothetical protein
MEASMDKFLGKCRPRLSASLSLLGAPIFSLLLACTTPVDGPGAPPGPGAPSTPSGTDTPPGTEAETPTENPEARALARHLVEAQQVHAGLGLLLVHLVPHQTPGAPAPLASALTARLRAGLATPECLSLEEVTPGTVKLEMQDCSLGKLSLDGAITLTVDVDLDLAASKVTLIVKTVDLLLGGVSVAGTVTVAVSVPQGVVDWTSSIQLGTPGVTASMIGRTRLVLDAVVTSGTLKGLDGVYVVPATVTLTDIKYSLSTAVLGQANGCPEAGTIDVAVGDLPRVSMSFSSQDSVSVSVGDLTIDGLPSGCLLAEVYLRALLVAGAGAGL